MGRPLNLGDETMTNLSGTTTDIIKTGSFEGILETFPFSESKDRRSYSTGDTLIVNIKGDIKVCVPNSIKLLTPYVLLEQEDWFEDEMEFVRHLLAPGMDVIDIGANYGLYSLTMAKAVLPNGRVWAFEPTSSTANYLQMSIKANGLKNVQLIQAGLSRHKGKAKIALNPNSELNRVIHGPGINDRCETIQLLQLDDCLTAYDWKDIAFLKLDAEGEEGNIIKGGSRFFSSKSPLVMFELKHGEEINFKLIDQFQKLGYSTYRFIPGLKILAPFDPSKELDDYQLNLFCCKKDCRDLLEGRGLLTSCLPHSYDRSALVHEGLWIKQLKTRPYARDFFSTGFLKDVIIPPKAGINIKMHLIYISWPTSRQAPPATAMPFCNSHLIFFQHLRRTGQTFHVFRPWQGSHGNWENEGSPYRYSTCFQICFNMRKIFSSMNRFYLLQTDMISRIPMAKTYHGFYPLS